MQQHGASSAVTVDAVTKSFAQAHGIVERLRARETPPPREVLRGISFCVARGEIFGLLGANGAGKTTLLKMLATLTVPTHGRITVGGYDTARDSLAARRTIGYVPADDRSFYYRMTARQNLYFFGTMAGVARSTLPTQIAHAAEVVGLSGELDRGYATYSTGMRQRLSIARALLHDPDVLLLDEPTRAVDPVAAERIRTTITRDLAQSGKTIVVSTNLLEEAWTICDRIAILRDGVLAALDTPADLRRRAQHCTDYRIIVDAADGDILDRIRAASGVRSAQNIPGSTAEILVTLDLDCASMNELLQAISCNGIQVRRVEPKEPQPAEIFSRLVEHA